MLPARLLQELQRAFLPVLLALPQALPQASPPEPPQELLQASLFHQS